MPTIDISRFNINRIEILEIPIWDFTNPTVNYINKPIVDIPGCVEAHELNKTEAI